MNFTEERHNTKAYREWVIKLTEKAFQKLENALTEMARNMNGIEQKVCIIPEQYFAMRYMNDAKDLSTDTTFQTEMFKKAKQKNVQCLCGRSLPASKSFTSSEIRRFQALRIIALGEEILPHVGNDYEFYR